MKMNIYPLEKPIIISPDKVTVLQVKNASLYSRIIESVNQLCKNKESDLSITLYDSNDEEMSFSKGVLFLSDLLNPDTLLKVFNKELYDKLKLEVQRDVDFQIKYVELVNEFENFILEDSPILDYGVKIDYQPTELDVFKFFKIAYEFEEVGTIFARVVKMIELVNQLQIDKLVVILNLKCFLSDQEWKKFLILCSSLKVCVLCLEGESIIKLSKEVSLRLIDEDLYEV